MLFQKDIEPRCTYCSRGTRLDEEKILCPKRGLVSPMARPMATRCC